MTDRDGSTPAPVTGPMCGYCRKRPSLSFVLPDGDRIHSGRCQICADALGRVHAGWTAEREARERRTSEMNQREREGLPAVASAPRFRREGA